MAVESDLQNAYESTLTAEMGPTALTAVVASISALTSPCYIVIEPDNDAQREFVYFDGTFGANSFVTTVIGNRYLAGSAAGSGLTHPIGSVVASVPMSQHFKDVHSRIDEKLDATGTAADSDLLESHAASYFATSAEFDGHDGGTDVADHPEATASVRGFMSAADKDKLDDMPDYLAPDGGTSSNVSSDNATSWTDLEDWGEGFSAAVQSSLETGTKALVHIAASLDNLGGQGTVKLGFNVSGASTVAESDEHSVSFESTATDYGARFGATFLVTGLTAGTNVFKLAAKVTSGGSHYGQVALPSLVVQPV